MNSTVIAENATMQSFLNCYLREIGNYEEECAYKRGSFVSRVSSEVEKMISIKLNRQQIKLILPVRYWSLTDRHLFQFPLYYQIGDDEDLKNMDYITLVTFLVKEWLLEKGKEQAEEELILRVILSCQKIKTYVDHRVKDAQDLTKEDFEYIDAEQSLLFGHMLHPTPKSKQGLTDQEDQKYSPEHQGEFQLHYFSAKKAWVLQDSSLHKSAIDIIYEDLYESADVDQEWLETFIDEERILIPVHPLQVPYLLEKSEVQTLMTTGELEYLGPLGRTFTPTSSFRTVYSRESKYMYKCSVPIKITNSLRVNQRKELARGVEVSRLLDTELGGKLNEAFPNFHIINDPAYLNLNIDEEVSGFEVIIRENPFYEQTENTSVIAALGQDHAYGDKPRIYSIIKGIAEREGRSVDEVSVDWFNYYLSLTVDPVLWLFQTYGIALEAHQQNSVIRMKNGYPDTFYYRDNQGYYFCESQSDRLMEFLPSLNQESDTFCEDEVAEERLRYYFIFNHLFGLINSFGTSGLIQEEKLMNVLRERLVVHYQKSNQKNQSIELLKSLLEERVLPCKANLLTRFYDMDELIGPMESQSVYTNVNNPLAKEV
ncbi:IucA/IucC family siderophore biosynthesis protein [Salibacterium salarium]|uniref:IucA/IucC family siderophore biosynthesis protein n=1 Tax=Salibacterium salarium TaxID=284579 RepID=A0A3R9R8N1_9BACI|nr:IucA/IucC family protein [Salibacterium salarium]RSL29723.1 IucA/IucC family siderophore biosynthesis protein [Salibacterium salarium]